MIKPDRPSAPLEWRHVAIVGILLAGIILMCWLCAWAALNFVEVTTR